MGLASGLTARSLILGFVLSVFVGALVPYLGLYVQGANPGAYFTSQIAHFLLFILIAVVNVVLGRCRRSWMLQRGELIVLFIMMSLANASPRNVTIWVPIVSAPYYHASAENNWLNLVAPYIPDWLLPHDPVAVRAFFEGSVDGSTRIPWDVWLEPILGWLPLILGLYFSTISLMVILRQQWVEKERLIYPIMQLNLEMVQPDSRGRLLAPFLRNKVMWMGFSVPMIVGLIMGLHEYYPFIPTINLSFPFPLFRTRLSFATTGFLFLVQREVVLGLWAFTLLSYLQVEIYQTIGWGIDKEPVISAWSYAMPSVVHQGMGAMVVLIVSGFWVAREHIGRVFRKAFTEAPEIDDGDEILSYRSAVLGLIIGLGAMSFWLIRVGIPPFAALVFLFCAFVVYVALTRVIAEGGVAVIYTPLVASDATLSALGSDAFGAQGVVGLSFTRAFAHGQLNFAMPHVANGLKLTGQIEGSRRALFWGMLGAVLLGAAASLWMLMRLAYSYGAINLRPTYFIWFPNYVFDYTVARLAEPAGASWFGWLHTAIGGIVMTLLVLARRFWTWWPVHPVGFPISATFDWIAFNAFIAWVIKNPVLRFGGVRLYRQVRPFFLGLILGHFSVFGLFWIIDAITGMVGNTLFL